MMKRKLGAPFSRINALWLGGDDYLPVFEKICGSIDGASAAGVKTVVCHVSSGWWPPKLCDIGFDRFDCLVDYVSGGILRTFGLI